MAFVTVINKEETKSYELFKRITTIGSSKEADIKINELAPIAAYITQNNSLFTIFLEDKNAKMLHKQKYIKSLYLSQKEEELELNDIKIIFTKDTYRSSINENKQSDNSLEKAYKKFLEFSQKIAYEKDVNNLFNTLLSEIISLSNGEYGFLVLIENNKPVIKVQKNHNNTNNSSMSDSIIKKVIETKSPIIVNNALNDQEFSSSMSVINYRLTSVMCTPLIYQGNIFGAIYVGNNSFINAFNEQSLSIMTIYSTQASLLLQNALYIEHLKNHNNILQEKLDLVRFGSFISACSSMQSVFAKVEKVSSSDAFVFITGEEGCGKELLAKEIHNRSLRKNGPFIAINCSSIQQELLESELFGHVKGAFSQAYYTCNGKFQAAFNGTLFLQNIDQLPLHIQAKILNILQEQKISKLGEQKSEPINIRVICSSTKNLQSLIKENLFRKDLYYLLSVVEIHIPALRERGNDVLLIANFLLQKYAKIYNKERISFDEDTKNLLINYSWPGNVKELENKICKALVLCDGLVISAKDLDITLEKNHKILSLVQAIERFKIKYINDSLERNAGNRTRTAQELEVDPRTIFRHLEQIKKSGDI